MKSDVSIKRLLQIKPEDWASFLFPELDEIKLEDMPTDMVPKMESRLDNVKRVNGAFISHVEPNGYLDHTLPARMLRYRADIREYTLYKYRELPPISQTVIMFFEKHDNKVHSLQDNYFEGQGLNYGYRVLKVWEIDPQDILSRKLTGLYPLLPIAKHGEGESGEQIITDSIDAIYTVEDAALRVDLLAVMSILAGEKYSKELVKKYIGREQLMESALFQEWVEEFVIEGKQEQKLEMAKRLLLRGMPCDEIIEITDLTMEEIENIKL